MDGIKYAIFIDKRSTRLEIKHWVELFFIVKAIAMNSHRLPDEGPSIRRPIMGHKMHCRCMIIMIQSGYSIPPFRK
ncbi:hypothetical protein K2173_012322 [Erythroxylum novogranatense]|uniref:Ribosomal protein L23 n=1 Tax=Erythroxylum novogranatense TaxID=1862640 RepID=A0AAV8SC23_9ROSI|nr:hypothetical protein K2173_012322 [Erythroxylum novogranatense]